MKTFSVPKTLLTISVLCAAATIAASAQTYDLLAKFTVAAGEGPNSPLVQGINGSLYTTALVGGANKSSQFCSGVDQDHCGTLLEVTPTGRLGVLYNFCAQANCADGGLPSAPLMLGPDGNFYGTTSTGGTSPKSSCQWSSGCGTIFRITPAGQLTVLYNVCSQSQCADGLGAGQLTLASNGNLYGVTAGGGINDGDAGCPNGCGTIFSMTPSGKFTTLYKFCSQVTNGGCADGMFPIFNLVQASNGNFYGMTYDGGASGVGNIFEITAAGQLTQIYSFCSQANCADGRSPGAPLTLGGDGNLYGTTSSGGAYGGGTAFKITPAGSFTTLYSFCNFGKGSCPDGSSPANGVIQATDGNLYGTAALGGNVNNGLCFGTGCGAAYQINTNNQVTNLYTFCAQAGCTDGAFPVAMMQATDGSFYGLAGKGGNPGCIAGGGCGTAWNISVGLAPFVQANPSVGHAGQRILILGNNLTGASSVTFNGTPAQFKIFSGTYLVALVPSGASTGSIQVTTPSGTLSSNVQFRIR